MKYYYNGELVRTSKNENYKYYCPLTGTCSATRKGALSVANGRLSDVRGRYEWYKKALTAVENGGKIRNPHNPYGKPFTKEELKHLVEHYEKLTEKYEKATVVELEARA